MIVESTIADAILDILIYTAHHRELKGESLRKNDSITLHYSPLIYTGKRLEEKISKGSISSEL